jgi:drug/metabolite transporter (DMT)-like permease
MNRYRLTLILGVICVSSAAVFIRLADAPPLVIAAYRLCLAALVIAPAALFRCQKEIASLGIKQILLAVFSGFLLALHFGLWIASLDYTSVASSVVLVTASPVFVAVVSYFLFKERITRMTLMGIVICIVGAGIIGFVNWETGSSSFWGAVLALLGAISVSGYMLIGRKLRQKMGVWVYIFLTYSAAGFFLLITVISLDQPLAGYNPGTYVMFILLALVPQVLGHTALNWSLRYISATLITVAVLGEPILATLLAYLVLGEIPQIAEVIGGSVILVGICIAFRKDYSPESQPERSS